MGRRIGFVSRAAVVSVVLGASVALAVSQGRVRMPVDRGEARSSIRPAVRVTGSAVGLYPGKVGWLRVVARNASGTPLRLRRISATVGAAAPGCPGSVLLVRPLRLHHRIRPGGVYRTRLRFTMLASASDDCQGATFPVTFRARTTR
jgi:hypothetical protein